MAYLGANPDIKDGWLVVMTTVPGKYYKYFSLYMCTIPIDDMAQRYWHLTVTLQLLLNLEFSMVLSLNLSTVSLNFVLFYGHLEEKMDWQVVSVI